MPLPSSGTKTTSFKPDMGKKYIIEILVVVPGAG
jgi:hypothetical protein